LNAHFNNVVPTGKPLTKDELIKDYGDVFKGLGKLLKAHHIQLDPFVEPVVHPPRKVPAALREQVRAEVDRMVNLGVIAKQDEPTDWVSSIVVVRKPGKLRICLDPKDLNRAIKREHYHLQTIDEIIERLPKACVFSRFDATHGFWYIQLRRLYILHPVDPKTSRALSYKILPARN
jgi:hypothetical protein